LRQIDSGLRRHPLRHDLRDANEYRQHVVRVWLREIVDPAEKWRAPQLNRRRQQRIERQENRQREQDWYAPAGWIHAALAIERLQLLVHFLTRWISGLQLGVPVLNGFGFWLNLLHLPHRHDALVIQRKENHVDDDGENQNRPAVIADVAMNPVE